MQVHALLVLMEILVQGLEEFHDFLWNEIEICNVKRHHFKTQATLSTLSLPSGEGSLWGVWKGDVVPVYAVASLQCEGNLQSRKRRNVTLYSQKANQSQLKSVQVVDTIELEDSGG